MYFSELIRYLPGRAEPEVLGRIKHADRKDQARRSRSYLVGRSAASVMVQNPVKFGGVSFALKSAGLAPLANSNVRRLLGLAIRPRD